jgi:ribose transport system substrate-binding protein
MRASWKICATTLVIISLLGLLSCGGGRHDADERYYLISVNVKIPYWRAAGAGFDQGLRQLRVRGEFLGPDSYDPAGQREELRRIVAQKPAGILVSVSDPSVLTPEINAAIDAGIPVVTIDADAPNSKRILFIGTDNYQAGVMGGEVLAKNLNGRGNVVVYTMPGQANLDERLHGYRDVLARHPGIRIVEVVDIKGDPRLAFDRTAAILGKRQDVNAFVCLEALAGKEVAEVISRNKATGKVVVAMDADADTLEWIRKGVIAATIGQKPYTMAFYGLKVLDDIYHHKVNLQNTDRAQDPNAQVPIYVDTGATLIDKSNVDRFMQAQQAKGSF